MDCGVSEDPELATDIVLGDDTKGKLAPDGAKIEGGVGCSSDDPAIS